MRLLVDCSTLSAGGGVQVAIAFLEKLRESSRVQWLAIVPSFVTVSLSQQMVNDVRIVQVKKSTHLDRIRIRNFLRTRESDFSPDVVFTVFGPAYFRARAPHLVGFAIPTLVYERDSYFMQRGVKVALVDWVNRLLVTKADHIIVETQTMRNRFIAKFAFDPSNVSVIGNAVNPLHSRLNIQSIIGRQPFTVLVPSTYYPHKNLEIVPKVAARMREHMPSLKFEFQLTLQATDPNWLAIQRDARRLNVADSVKTLGVVHINVLGRAYEEASAVFLPTLREASTAVYPESFFFRRPLITSDMEFARELCGDAALYVPPLDPTKIASQICNLAVSPASQGALVVAGDIQLQTYPSADRKFSMQMELIEAVLRRSRQK